MAGRSRGRHRPYIVLLRLRKKRQANRNQEWFRLRVIQSIDPSARPSRRRPPPDWNAESTAIFSANLGDARCQPLLLLRCALRGFNVWAVIFFEGQSLAASAPPAPTTAAAKSLPTPNLPLPPPPFLRLASSRPDFMTD